MICYYDYMKRSVLKIFLILNVLLVTYPVVGDVKAYEKNADTQTDISIDVKNVIASYISYTPITFEADNNLHTSSINLSITANNETGSVTTMSTIYDSDNTNATKLMNHDQDAYIATLDSSVSSSSFTMNRWGFSIDSGSTFKPLTPKDGEQSVVMSLNRAMNDARKEIVFGVKASKDAVPGAYVNTVLFTTVANPVPIDLSKITYMQDMTAEICANTRTVTASETESVPQYRLIDKRDGQAYWVAKLADGKCWMTQNLNLDLYQWTEAYYPTVQGNLSAFMPSESYGYVNQMVLNDMTSDLNTKTTYRVEDSEQVLYPFNGVTYYNNEQQECDGVSDGKTISGVEQMSGVCPELFQYNMTESTGVHGLIGGYYSRKTATTDKETVITSVSTGGSVSVPSIQNYDTRTDSICPRGWTLPEDEVLDNLGNVYGDNNNLYGAPLYYVPSGFIRSVPTISSKGVVTAWHKEVNEVGKKALLLKHRWLHFDVGSITAPEYRPSSGMSSDFYSMTNNLFSSGYTSDVNGSISLYNVRCVAREPYSSVRYDVNGGIEMEDLVRQTNFDEYSSTVTVTEKIPERDGYSFAGWSTNKNATVPMYSLYDDRYPNTITFSGDITLYAVWNKTFDLLSIASMQEMTSEICQNSSVGDSKRLVDKRDLKRYWVTKLADDKCWMTQNLDLDLNTNKTLTPQDTDILANWTPVNSTMSAGDVPTKWGITSQKPESVDVGDIYRNTRTADYATQVGTDEWWEMDVTLFTSRTPFPENGEHGHFGNYYNAIAAMAKNTLSFTNNTSICPKGWRLPTMAEYKFFYPNGIFSKDNNPQYLIESGDANPDSDPTYRRLDKRLMGGSYWCSGKGSEGSEYMNRIYIAGAAGIYYQSDQWYKLGYSVRCISR